MTSSPQAVALGSNERSMIRHPLEARLSEAVAGVVADIVSTTAVDRADRLWPADVLVYETNPLSLSYGACGTALVLRQLIGEVPAEAETWILGQSLSTESYPPGLYVGLAGIARAFAWMGHIERAQDAMKLAYNSPLLFEEVGVDHGMAGWGLASLAMHRTTGDDTHLDFAVRAGEQLLEAAVRDARGLFWPSRFDGRAYLGYAYGTCGIACFLIRLYEMTQDARFRSAAVEGMEFTLQQAGRNGDRLQWPSYVGSRIAYPYWRLGAAGVGAALLRFHAAMHDDRYLADARRVANGLRMLFAAVPGQFDGMSSVGDFLLDMHAVTGEHHYYLYAREIAESVLCFQVPTAAGITFPGRLLMRLSSDYAHGAAGTAAFLQRVLAPMSRSLDSMLYSES